MEMISSAILCLGSLLILGGLIGVAVCIAFDTSVGVGEKSCGALLLGAVLALVGGVGSAITDPGPSCPDDYGLVRHQTGTAYVMVGKILTPVPQYTYHCVKTSGADRTD